MNVLSNVMAGVDRLSTSPAPEDGLAAKSVREYVSQYGCPHHFSVSYSGEATLLTVPAARLRILDYARKAASEVRLAKGRRLGKPVPARLVSDARMLSSPFIGLTTQSEEVTVLFCETLPDGTWRTSYALAPLSRVWPPQSDCNEYDGVSFLTDRNLAYVRTGAQPRLQDLHTPGDVGPVDVVYTWVDGDDRKWQVKKALTTKGSSIRSADNAQRYMSRDELRYSIRSIYKFAPWVRQIFIVTDGQSPAWLRPTNRIQVVDHREIFARPENLPVFNSHAIESQLHRIPDLSEHFLYLNDDMMLGSHVGKDTFFSKGGISNIFLSQISMIDRTRPQELCVPTDYAGYNTQDLIERDFGVVPCRKMLHAPYALRKSIFQEMNERYSDEFERTASARLRSLTDIAVPSMFYHYYAWATGRATLAKRGANRYTYIDTGKAGLQDALAAALAEPPHFLCLNTTEFDEIGRETENRLVHQFLEALHPESQEFEV